MTDPGPQNGQERATERAEATLTAWTDRPTEGPETIRTTTGQEVILERVELVADEVSGVSYLDVYVGGDPECADPHFRVVNPPTLVRDPEGDRVIRGERFRVDPLAALAEAVADNGGSQAQKRRYGR